MEAGTIQRLRRSIDALFRFRQFSAFEALPLCLLPFQIQSVTLRRVTDTVGVAQLAEHRVVAPVVVGSIPITHPILCARSSAG